MKIAASGSTSGLCKRASSTHDAHDLHPGRLAHAEGHTLPDGSAVRPVLAGQRLAQDDHRHPVRPVPRVEGAPLQDALAEQLEVAGRHRVERLVVLASVGVAGLAPLYGEAEGRPGAVSGRLARPGRAGHAGDGAHALQEPHVERHLLGDLGVAGARQVHVHQDEPFRVEAQLGRLQRAEGTHK
jgi:hypothetical protein